MVTLPPIPKPVSRLPLGLYRARAKGSPDVVTERPGRIKLVKNGNAVGRWAPGKWPDSGFLQLMNVNVSGWEKPNDRAIVIRLENGIEIHLADDSDQYECIQITTEGKPGSVII